MDHRFDWILESQRLGFIGPSAPDVHLEQAFFFSSIVSDCLSKFPRHSTPTLFDLGTGGGFPGLVIAQLLPELHVFLVESMAKRAAFLDSCILSYGIDNRCQTLHCRAEILGHRIEFRESAQFVTAKAFGKTSITAECASGLVAVGGFVLVSDPPAAVRTESARWNDKYLMELGLQREKIITSPFAITVLKKVKVLGDRYPRETQRLIRNPLF